MTMLTPVPPLSSTNLFDPSDPAQQLERASALIALYDRSVDSAKGFAKMVEKAEPKFRDTAERFRALHVRHVHALARLLVARGTVVDGDGTLMGAVNQAVVAFRAFFDDIDEDVMDQVRSGEDWVLKMFDEGLTQELGANAGTAAQLHDMRAELTDLLAETRHLG